MTGDQGTQGYLQEMCRNVNGLIRNDLCSALVCSSWRWPSLVLRAISGPFPCEPGTVHETPQRGQSDRAGYVGSMSVAGCFDVRSGCFDVRSGCATASEACGRARPRSTARDGRPGAVCDARGGAYRGRGRRRRTAAAAGYRRPASSSALGRTPVAAQLPARWTVPPRRSPRRRPAGPTRDSAHTAPRSRRGPATGTRLAHRRDQRRTPTITTTRVGTTSTALSSGCGRSSTG
jgi:hypothetical protein